MRLVFGLFVAGLLIGVLAASVVPVPPRAGAVAVAATQAVSSELAVSGGPVAAAGDVADSCEPAPLRRRAAQVLVVGMPGVVAPDDDLARELVDLGVGGVFVNDANVVTAEQVSGLVYGLKASSGVPLMVATDEEAGRVSTFRHLIGVTSSPRTLAATRTPDEVREYAAELAAGLSGLGVNTDMAPVADLDGGPSTGVIGDRSFSADPAVAAEYAAAFAAGLADGGVLPVVKHFPGLGQTGVDVHRAAATVTTPLADLLRHDVQPFVSLIAAGAPVVMLGHAQYAALDAERPASLSAASYRLLRELGFDGVAMTDSLGMGAVHRRWDFPEAAVLAVEAGADAVLATDGRHARDMRDAIVRAVRRGVLDEGRLNEAAARMLALKGVDPRPLTCTSVPAPPVMAQRLLSYPGG